MGGRGRKRVTVWLCGAGLTVLAALAALLVVTLVHPDVSRLRRENPGKTAFMEYRERQWREAGLSKRVRQVWTPLAAISPYAVKAVIIAEDDKFWSHEGFDFEAIQRALEKDLRQRKLKAGGSTISQQLAKNLYLTPAKNPLRKVREAILTWRLERSLSKRRIIEIYLNVAEWGDGIFGIEAAARHYFGKSAASLGAAEAARLAVVLPSPLRYNPTGPSRYVAARAEAILRVMVRRGIVIPEYEALMNETPPAGAEPAVEAESPLPGEGPAASGQGAEEPAGEGQPGAGSDATGE